VTKNAVALNYSPLGHYPVVNKGFHDSLPDDLRVIFDECLDEYLVRIREAYDGANASSFSEMEQHGVTVYYPTDEELQAWKDKVIPLWEQFSSFYTPEALSNVRELVGK
jgi:C4-dicarboxylate-binding protein DctP